MPKVLVYYAHPGQRFSHVNKAMFARASEMEEITSVDLYARYPRFNIDVDAEQALLSDHDIILFQHPLFWYSTPSLIKEWMDLVLEHGFAYGSGGDSLRGKVLMQAVSAAGPEDAYARDGYQHFPLRTFLTPMEQTANLCQMHHTPPYVLYASLKAPDAGQIAPHVDGYARLLTALAEGQYDYEAASKLDVITYDTLPIRTGG